MVLTIQNIGDYQLLNKFINLWVLPVLKSNLKHKIVKNKLQLLDTFGDNVYQDLMDALNYLAIYHVKDSNVITISVDQNKKNKEETAKLYDICAMVNFGSLSYPPCPIFTKTFEYFAEKFWMLYNDYAQGFLPCP